MKRSVLSREEKVKGIIKAKFAGVQKRNRGVQTINLKKLTLALLWDALRWASRVSLGGRMALE